MGALWQSLVGLISEGIEFFGQMTGNYGWGIILLTLLVRLVLVPLTMSQNRATLKMRELNPELERLKAKYKDDSQKLNEETIKLWKEHGVNPAAGCLPMLVQMPVIIAIFSALRGFEFAADASFMWLPNLAQPDPLYILPVLAAISTYVQTKISTGDAEAAGGSQAVMLYAMPLFIGYISMQFPAGLALYWTVTNIFGVGQQYVVNALASADRDRQEEGESD
ncbi:MAG: YidC/Oxa1 family membrane protein insertase [Bacillota bacterium]